MAYRGSLDSDHIWYGLLSGSSDAREERLRSGSPVVLAVRNLLNNLTRLGIRASEWTNYRWNTSTARVHPGSCFHTQDQCQACWDKLTPNSLVLAIPFVMHKWSLAPSPNCKCNASEQTTDHVLTACPIHRAPYGAGGLMVLDEKTRHWLNKITASI